MRYESKQALIDDIRAEHDAFCALLQNIPAARQRERGVWGDGWSVVDLVAHLAEWQRMFLGWHSEGEQGRKPQMPASGYKWNQLTELNRAIQAKHQARDMADVRRDFESGYEQILKLAESLPPRSLLQPGRFHWTGKCPLRTYLGANTASHYRFAINIIRRWNKKESGNTAASARSKTA